MSDVQTGRAPATEAEINRLNRDLAKKLAARAAPQPVDRRRRKPLGLAPDLGVVEPEAAVASASPTPPAGGNEDELTALLNEIVEWVGNLQSSAQSKFNEMRAEIAKVAAENETLKVLVEHARAASRGEPGVCGPRGAPGQQGPIGPVGQTGARGSRGQPGDRIVSWRLAPDEFLAFPIAETGKELPPLNLMPFFTEYNSATEASEVELASEQVGLQRARVELETARVNAGLPAR